MTTAIAETDRRFAREEARGRSPLYEVLTESVADDSDLLAHLADLPPAKQQLNLPGPKGTLAQVLLHPWSLFHEQSIPWILQRSPSSELSRPGAERGSTGHVAAGIRICDRRER